MKEEVKQLNSVYVLLSEFIVLLLQAKCFCISFVSGGDVIDVLQWTPPKIKIVYIFKQRVAKTMDKTCI
jgi:hypothetical protein